MANRKGFTLSEVMITLGVLGILAAVIIPTATKITPDANKIMFKKSYFSLENIVSKLINDDINYPDVTSWDNGGSPVNCAVSGVTVSCGFNNASTSGTLVPAGQNKFCYLLADAMNTVGTVNCATASINTDLNTWNFKTTDGIMWKMGITPDGEFPFSSTAYGVIIVMDVNGIKSPNCIHGGSDIANIGSNVTTCAVNVTADRYEVGVRYDGKLNIVESQTNAINILTDPLNNKK